MKYLLMSLLFVVGATANDGNKIPKIPNSDSYVEAEGQVTIDGKEVAYRTKTGHKIVRKDDGTPLAAIFYIAYLKKDAEASNRPLTFSFNGGPGSSSVWLHMGLLGPRVVKMGKEGEMLKPPFTLRDNPWSLLDKTDLVFIDPVSTGFSRPATGQDRKQFHGVNEDISSVGDFIAGWTSEHERWSSPKFIIGESYGTTRAAGLAGYLQRRHGLFPNGLMLVSAILDWLPDSHRPGNDMGYMTYLPTMTATAWYHKKLPQDLASLSLEAVVEKSRQFAFGDYYLALLQGDGLPEDQHKKIVAELARFTGLSADYIEDAKLRVRPGRFYKELLRDRRQTVGRLDSRFTGVDGDAAGESNEYDPSMAAIMGPYSHMVKDYIANKLNYKTELTYNIFGPVRPWNYAPYHNRYVNVAETLRAAMTYNPELKIYVANGYYDFATPFGATEYTIDHMMLEPRHYQNISMFYYPAGHMMYIQEASLIQMRKDLVTWMESAL